MKTKQIIIWLLLSQSAIGLTQLDTENADRDLTSQVTVLTHTPSATVPMQCQGLVYFGDGAKNLSGTSGTFRVEITIGGQTLQPNPQSIYFTTAARSCVYTSIFPVPANAEVVIKILSPVSTDTDVDTTAYLYSLDPQINAIEADTDELQTDWTDGGRLDLILDSIKVVTDFMAIQLTVATADDANSFTLSAGAKDTNDVYVGMMLTVEDADDGHEETRYIVAYEDTRVISVDRDYGFTPAIGDLAWIWTPSYYPIFLFEQIERNPSVVHRYDALRTTTVTGEGALIRHDPTLGNIDP